LASQYPERFAAIAPICGGGDPDTMKYLKDVPTWAFHGTDDDVVPIKASEMMVEALAACGGDVKFTIYPEVKHDAWTETYDNPELYEWFLQHSTVNR
jgi:predicted peptidase